MPARLREAVLQGTNRLVVSLDGGWEVSFRIHNATSRLEPSLKFDVQMVGIPQVIYANDRHWDETGTPADPQRPPHSDAGSVAGLSVRATGGTRPGELA